MRVVFFMTYAQHFEFQSQNFMILLKVLTPKYKNLMLRLTIYAQNFELQKLKFKFFKFYACVLKWHQYHMVIFYVKLKESHKKI